MLKVLSIILLVYLLFRLILKPIMHIGAPHQDQFHPDDLDETIDIDYEEVDS